jgi:molybdenum-dependent DNA-binding transcriptional regulator ModE
MGVLANNFRDSLGAFQIFGATASNNAYPSVRAANYARTAAMRNLTAGEGITSELVSLPSGNRHPSAWMLPQQAGALAARNTVTGDGGITNADRWAVKLAEAAISGTGGLTAFGGLVVQLLADIGGSGTITAASLQAFLAAVADLTGSGGISDAELEGVGALLAALAGEGTLDASVLTGIGELDADIVVTGTGLSTANVGQAVWAALAAANNTAGTMGALLNGGSAGGLTTEQATQLLEIFQRLGLDIDKPLTQTATEISTDDWTLAVTEGVGTVTVERQ